MLMMPGFALPLDGNLVHLSMFAREAVSKADPWSSRMGILPG